MDNHKFKTKYSDPWTDKDVLFKSGYPSANTEYVWDYNFDYNLWTYERWSDVWGYENAPLFEGQPSYTDPN